MNYLQATLRQSTKTMFRVIALSIMLIIIVLINFGPIRVECAYASALIDVSTNPNTTITSSDEEYEIIGTNSNGFITIAPDVTGVVLKLNNVSLTSSSQSPLRIGAGAEVTIVLLDDTTNTFTCNGTSTAEMAPQSGIHVQGAKYNKTATTNAALTVIADTVGNGKLIAKSGLYSAGIGGAANEGNGNISILGGIIESTARMNASHTQNPYVGNGAGIGSGGSRTYQRADSTGIITISGDANVTAISEGDGAGIGGSGTATAKGDAGRYGLHSPIVISENATVVATSKGNGAGIGGGGASDFTSDFGHAGTTRTITISESARVTATSEGNGAGIGGGGSTGGNASPAGNINISGSVSIFASNNGDGAGIGGGGSITGNPGAGGNIVIEEGVGGAPIIVAGSSAGKDIGPGAKNGIDGNAGTIVITSGNIYAENATEVTNGLANGNQILTMENVTGEPDTPLPIYTVNENESNEYSYKAKTDNVGDAFVWKTANSPNTLSINEKTPVLGKIYNTTDKVELEIESFNGESFRSEIISIRMHWFRVPISDTTSYSVGSKFDLKFASYNENSDYSSDFGLEDAENGAYEHSFTLESDKNATYWIRVEYVKIDGTSEIMHEKFSVENYYTPISVSVRDVKEEDGVIEEIKEYTFLDDDNDISTPYGIPFDLDGSVINVTPKFGYDELVYEWNSNTKAPYWDLELAQPPFDFSDTNNLIIVLDNSVLGGLGADLQSTLDDIYYTAIYKRNETYFMFTAEKMVTGKYGNRTKPFDFEVQFYKADRTSLYDKEIEYKIIDMVTDNTVSSCIISASSRGYLSFQLTHNQKIVFSYFHDDDNVWYEVGESQIAGYSTNLNGILDDDGNVSGGIITNNSAGEIGDEGQDEIVRFYNMATEVPQMGQSIPDNTLSLIIIGLTIIIVSIVLWCLRIKYHNS